MLRSPFGVAVSQPRLVEAANSTLDRAGTAVDACIASFLMGAALWPGVALGAATVLTAGPGVGARYFDGSLLQPGRGAPRPRGFRDGDVIPEAAHVGVSSAIVALYAAHSHDSTISLSELASPAVKAAAGAGLRGRAALLRRIGAGGPLATRDLSFVQETLEIGGRAVGGCVTDADLQDAIADASAPETLPRFLRGAAIERPPLPVPLDSFVVCACDSRGVIAVMHVAYDPKGIEIPVHEVTAPRTAVPVRRGVPRVTPGTRLGALAPIAILTDDSGVVWCGVAFDSTDGIAVDELGLERAEGLTIDQVLRSVLATRTDCGSRACAVVRASGAGGAVRAIQVQGGPAT